MLTSSERRGMVIVAVLLMLGSAYDLWHARPGREPSPLVLERAGTSMRDSAQHAATVQGVESALGGAAERGSDAVIRVDLNRARPDELERLPGIGPVIAGRIVAHRDQHGAFQRVDDLLAVRGIGPRLLERLEGQVVVGP